MILDQLGGSRLAKNGQDQTVLACSLWIGQSNTNPLNYPISLLEDDLCKTKVLKFLYVG